MRAPIATFEHTLPGRPEPLPLNNEHFVLHTPLKPPFAGKELAAFAMGCFWGAERYFWQALGVYSTAVGYAGGATPNPTYEEVCSGQTGHTESVLVAFDPASTDFAALLKLFWENHDPTQGMRQGNDVGTQYRSAVFTSTAAQHSQALHSKAAYERALAAVGYPGISTQIAPLQHFYFAENYHQQYLAKNPAGYCGIGGTGVPCPGLIR